MNDEADHPRDIRQQAVPKNIDSILELEKEDERQLSNFHKMSHTIGWFVGTVRFVIFQIVLVVSWIALNAHPTTRFDPYPFNLLSAVLAFEAVLLTAFVLIRQNAMDQRSEHRNHLDLQINLLVEKEATSILNKLDAIAKKLQVEYREDPETSELAKDIPVESIARDLRSKKGKASA